MEHRRRDPLNRAATEHQRPAQLHFQFIKTVIPVPPIKANREIQRVLQRILDSGLRRNDELQFIANHVQSPAIAKMTGAFVLHLSNAQSVTESATSLNSAI